MLVSWNLPDSRSFHTVRIRNVVIQMYLKRLIEHVFVYCTCYLCRQIHYVHVFALTSKIKCKHVRVPVVGLLISPARIIYPMSDICIPDVTL